MRAVTRIGETWGGGIYAGLTRSVDMDNHLVLANPALWVKRDVNYGYACEWANSFTYADYTDFRLPTRREAALLYANLQDHFEDLWYWTSDLYPPDNKCVWVQTFGYGRQADARMTDACRACAVRTIPVSQG